MKETKRKREREEEEERGRGRGGLLFFEYVSWNSCARTSAPHCDSSGTWGLIASIWGLRSKSQRKKRKEGRKARFNLQERELQRHIENGAAREGIREVEDGKNSCEGHTHRTEGHTHEIDPWCKDGHTITGQRRLPSLTAYHYVLDLQLQEE
jgi:hypothetical protein